ncbi:MAG: isoprenylcysteine carboxylmethyltransferase family protein [Myxococcota bacterium]
MSVAGSALAFIGLLLGVGLLRIAELVVSRAHSKRAGERGERPRPELAFVFMVALHTVPFWLSPVEVFLWHRPFLPALAGVSGIALLLAGGLRIWTLRTLGAAWNVRIVKPGAVVTSGPYRFIRHPNYLVVITELLFLPLFHSAYFTALVLTVCNALVLWKRIPAEEKVLFEVPGYRELMGPKPRFLPF